MRVLLTGCTRLMAGDEVAKNTSYISFAPLLWELLEQLPDVEVVQTVVMPGDTDFISQFDLALVGMAAVNGFSGKKHRWSAMWAMSQLPHVVWVDDWQVGSLISSLRREKETWKTAMLTKDELQERELGLKVKPAIERVRTHLHRGFTTGEHGTVLAPLFKWGDWEKFREQALPCRRLLAIDPSAGVPDLAEYDMSFDEKDRAWAYAGLKDHSNFFEKKMSPTWPLRTIMPQQGKRGGWGRITEKEVVTDYYEPNWGNIVVPYGKKMRSTGWWRSRYNYGMQAGNVLWVSHDDLGRLDYTYFPSIAEVEALSNEGLEDLHLAQRQELERREMDQAEITDTLLEAINSPEEPIR